MTTFTADNRVLWSLALLLLASAGCKNTAGDFELISLEESDCLDVTVEPVAGDDDDSAGDDDDSAAAADEVVIELHPQPGIFELDVLGVARLSPVSGPAGTEFQVSVTLVDIGASQGNPTTAVDRATLVVDNGSLALDVLEMDPSPVDERLWTITVVAGGDPATTTREDRLCVGLYTETE